MVRPLCVFLAGMYCAFPQAQTPNAAPATISGTVLNSVTGQPIAGALVVADIGFATENGGKLEKREITDPTGRFSFEVERPPQAKLRVSRTGYRSSGNYDEATANLFPGTGDATVRLVPQSVITGRVVSGEGEPLSGITVEAVLISLVDGRRQFRENYASQETDDRGEYRLWNIPPGSYYVKVAGRTSMRLYVADNAGFDLADEAYGPLYYPSAPDRDAAQVIHIQGGETINASFRVGGRQAFQLSGKIVNGPAQRPYMIRLLHGADPTGNRASVNMAAQTFQVADVMPGTYTLQIYTSDARPVSVGELPVTISDKNLSGLYVTMTAGFEVQARLESGGDLGPISVVAQRSDSTAPPNAATSIYSIANPDGSYSLKQLLPGKYDISVRGPADRYPSSVRASGGIDVLAEGLTVTAGGAGDLTVTLGAQGGGILGNVDGASDSWKVVNRNSSGQVGGIDVFGAAAFQLDSLKPGEYTLYAWPASHPIEFRNPAVLGALSRYGVVVKVGEGETRQITLKPIPLEALP